MIACCVFHNISKQEWLQFYMAEEENLAPEDPKLQGGKHLDNIHSEDSLLTVAKDNIGRRCAPIMNTFHQCVIWPAACGNYGNQLILGFLMRNTRNELGVGSEEEMGNEDSVTKRE
ncbi:uncharacterized protein LOC144681637 [Cetorhinus maximus]